MAVRFRENGLRQIEGFLAISRHPQTPADHFRVVPPEQLLDPDAGAFLAFMASIDNVPVSLFLSNARTDTLPIRMWGMMEATLDVRVAAVSGVLIAAAFLLMLIMEWTVGLTRRMRD